MKISSEIILSTVFAVIVGIEGQYGSRLYRRVNNNYNRRYQDENIDDSVQQLSENGLIVEPRYKPYWYGLGGALLGAATAGVLKNKKKTGVGTNEPLIISQVQDIPICIVTSNKKKKHGKKNRSYNGRTLTESEMKYVRQILSSMAKEGNSNDYAAEDDSTLPNTSDDEGLEEQEEQTEERKPQNYSPLLAVLRSKKSKRRRGNKQPSKYNEGYADDDDDLHNRDEDEDEYYNKPNFQRRRKHKIKNNEDEESEIEADDDDDDEDDDGDEKHNDSYEDDENEDDEDEETYKDIVRHVKPKKRKRHRETINCITIKHKYSIIKSGGNSHQKHGFHSGNDLYGLHQYIGIDNNQYHQSHFGGSSFLSGIPLLSNLVGLKGRDGDGAIQYIQIDNS